MTGKQTPSGVHTVGCIEDKIRKFEEHQTSEQFLRTDSNLLKILDIIFGSRSHFEVTFDFVLFIK
jgi:hypothetical protein